MKISERITFEPMNPEDSEVFLSDIPYKTAKVGWGSINFDKNNSNASLSLLINGSTTPFKKGIWAHATSTVEYDISRYKDEYPYFVTYYGIDRAASNSGNGVKFYIYTSVDGTNWELRTEENPTALKSGNNAVYVKIDVRNANFIRLYANDNGSNASDHATWGDAKLVKESYKENVTTTVEEFDEIIKANYTSGPISDDLKLILLQRDLVNHMGQYQLRLFLEEDPRNKETLEWFMNDEEALRLWTVGGRPDGSYLNALKVLSNLYHAHKEDLSNEQLTDLGTPYKNLYLRMMLSISLTHSTKVALWIDGAQSSNPVTRYEIFKKMHLEKKLFSNTMFENLTVEEMRWVMNNIIDDEEIEWLNNYSRKWSNQNDRYNPYKYINYTLNYSYWRPKYYSQENYATWNNKYKLSDYNITYRSGKPKLWIVFEEGAVCGGLSKTASNLWGSWGVPSSVVGQPGHAAFIYYYTDGAGRGKWQLSNSIASTAWANTARAEKLGVRMPNAWGEGNIASWTNTLKPASYILLAQEAQNDYNNYEKAELIMLLENVYKDDKEKLEIVYRSALNEEPINLDAWIGLVNLYINDTSKTDEDLYGLVEEISEVYAYHPLPMYDLMRKIYPHLSGNYKAKLLIVEDRTLRAATKATGAQSIQSNEISVVAQAILGEVDPRLATFSFDGANAGKIVLSKQLQSAEVTWNYSLDGGQTWKECYEHSVQLTEEEIGKITPENDIKVHLIGLDYSEANIYTIDITKGTFPSGVVSIDDLENRINGATNKMEWTLDTNGEWNSFADTNPIFNGNVRVYVRVRATGTNTMTDPVYFTFTTNTSSENHRYIPRGKLKVTEVSGTSGGNKDNILDGDINTSWHGPHENGLGSAYIPSYAIIELDKPRYVSELDYVPDAKATGMGNYPTGKAKKLEIYVSMDGTNWELAASQDKLANNANLKKIAFPEAKEAKYVKIHCPSVHESGLQHYFSIAVINLYEDPSASETPTADINYNIIKATNKDVVAELINESRHITVTNNDGNKTYTFTENGDFTFEFVDNNGHKGSTTAHVDWIDKVIPEANVTFSTNEQTSEDVVATITFTKEVTILSKDVYVTEDNTITFVENASYELEFVDGLGNVGTKTITVDWIDKEEPTAEFTFSTMDLTEESVTVTLVPSEEVTITNNEGRDTYTFEENGSFTFKFVDRAGNEGTATATVNWIAKQPTVNLIYSTTTLTKENVEVTLEIEDGYRILSNNGGNVYTFEENGSFDFEYMDSNGIRGKVTAVVDWIDKEEPTATFEYSITSPTNNVVVATIKPSEEVTILNNNGGYTYTFEKNGEFTFELEDRVGNRGTATAVVNWIDKEKPTATIEYSTTEQTKDSVIATLVNPSEEITIVNNEGKNTYTFTRNGEFIFIIEDKAGNRNEIKATVTWIETDSNITSDIYVIKDMKVSQILADTTVEEFKKNVSSKQEIILKDKNDEIVSNETNVGTGMKAVVGEDTYTLIVMGDVDGNGKVTILDLAKLRLHCIEYSMLEGVYKEAADLDSNGNITINDLAKLKRILISK